MTQSTKPVKTGRTAVHRYSGTHYWLLLCAGTFNTMLWLVAGRHCGTVAHRSLEMMMSLLSIPSMPVSRTLGVTVFLVCMIESDLV